MYHHHTQVQVTFNHKHVIIIISHLRCSTPAIASPVLPLAVCTSHHEQILNLRAMRVSFSGVEVQVLKRHGHGHGVVCVLC